MPIVSIDSKKLFHAVVANGRPVTELAKNAGMNPVTIWLCMRFDRDVRHTTLSKLARVLSVDYHTLLKEVL